MLSFEDVEFHYEPYPIAVVRTLFDADVYREMLEQWPPLDLHRHIGEAGAKNNKFSLDERSPGGKHARFVAAHPVWKEFHGYIKSEAFVGAVLDLLREHGVDLGYKGKDARTPRPRNLAQRVRWSLRGAPTAKLTSKLQFSSLQADRGCVAPHSDELDRVATLVTHMPAEGEWDERWGGGLDVNRVTDPTQAFNLKNRKFPFHLAEVVRNFPFRPNQGVLVVKTFNSWHSVRPIRCEKPDVLRRSLTISINRVSG